MPIQCVNKIISIITHMRTYFIVRFTSTYICLADMVNNNQNGSQDSKVGGKSCEEVT